MNNLTEVRRIFISGKTLWRAYMNAYVQGLELQDPVLDVGSGKLGTASYQRMIPNFAKLRVTSLDIAPHRRPDVQANAQQGIPFQSSVFRTCLMFNVFEYLSDYTHALREVHRVLAPDGEFIVAVPFLSRVHSDNDVIRMTGHGLTLALYEAGFSAVDMIPLGSGAFGAALEQVEFGIPRLLRGMSIRIAIGLDKLATRRSGGVYRNASDYPLGYIALARK